MSALRWDGVHISPAVHRCPRRRNRAARLRGGLLALGRLALVLGLVLVQAAVCVAIVLALVFGVIALWGPR